MKGIFAGPKELYHTYDFKYPFNRDIIISNLNVRASYGSKILKKCKDSGIIRMEKRSVYFFNRPKNYSE